MKYRRDQKSGNELSVLGFGCMRFPRNPAQIDMQKTEKLILTAVEKGVNYFDTAYLYPGSEEALGSIVSKNNLRDKIYIATKLPIMKCYKYEDFDALFETSLKRLKTDYIDYYLLHNITSYKTWKALADMGIEKWIEEKKQQGKIKSLGFSFHGIHSEFIALLEAYNWDFCQIQYNYMNINYQAGEAGLKKAASMGLPVIIMEPLLGGKLAGTLPKKVDGLFKKADPSATAVSWALNWLWNQPEVTVVLSGMNDYSQLSENLDLADNSSPHMLTGDKSSVFEPVIEAFRETYKIPCTGCNYCMPCPKNVNIPGCFAAYNLSYSMGLISGYQQYITGTGATNLKQGQSYRASNCIGCGKCEKHCPQNIQISQKMKVVRKRMEPFWFAPIMKMASKIMN